jgi:hypothetical protein
MNLHTIGRVMRAFSPHILKSLSSIIMAGLAVAAMAHVSSANAAFRSNTFRVGLTIVAANRAPRTKHKMRLSIRNACGESENILKFKEFRFQESLRNRIAFDSKPQNPQRIRKYVVCIY